MGSDGLILQALATSSLGQAHRQHHCEIRCHTTKYGKECKRKRAINVTYIQEADIDMQVNIHIINGPILSVEEGREKQREKSVKWKSGALLLTMPRQTAVVLVALPNRDCSM